MLNATSAALYSLAMKYINDNILNQQNTEKTNNKLNQ